jgi:cyclopropane fatty-acyl-phospholipid synthase-like methyltransferase
MGAWNEGYVTNILYTYGYYTELNPLRAKLALLNQGIEPPQIHTACELGFGQGLSINIHGAASDTYWIGTDFNPSQAKFAQSMAEASQAQIDIYDQSFAQFCQRDDLPEFDYIGLHGIWSWISDENRKYILHLIRNKLKLGGLVYISYNTHPGWSAGAPLQQLMTQYSERLTPQQQDMAERIDQSLEFIDRFAQTNPRYLQANAYLKEKIAQFKHQDRHYLAHEFFNKDWHLEYFHTLAQQLESEKLSFAASANLLDNIEVVNLTPEQQKFLNSTPDLTLRQTVRDMMVNQQFRRDYWIKGVRRLTVHEQQQALRKLRVILTAPVDEIPLEVTGSLGKAPLSEKVYKPILECMADYQPHSFDAILEKVPSINLGQLVEAALILTSKGALALAQDDEVIEKATASSRRLNQFILERSITLPLNYLSSPVTGVGIAIDRVQQLFVKAIINDMKTIDEMTNYTWKHLRQVGQRIQKEGKVLESDQENVKEIRDMAEQFHSKRLPLLRSLRVV